MQALRIRPAAAQDRPVLRAGAVESAWESLSPAERAALRPGVLPHYVESLLQMLAAQPAQSVVLVAELGGESAGHLLAAIAPDSSTGEPQGMLFDLFVPPHLRRRGIGRQLQASGEQILAARGLRKIKMWTGLHNQGAVRMATACGFQPEGLIGLKEW
jgi:GNAT superfamily N-acetyltransferase